MSGWEYDDTLTQMANIVRKPYVMFPYVVYHRVDHCDKIELQDLWDQTMFKLNIYYNLIEDEHEDISDDDRDCFWQKIDELEAYLEEIDYQWSRLPKTVEEREAVAVSEPEEKF